MVKVFRNADARYPGLRRLIECAIKGDVEANEKLIAMVADHHRHEADEIRNARARQNSGKREPVMVDIANMGPPRNGLPEAVHLWASAYLTNRLNPANRPPDSPDAQHIKRLIIQQYWSLRNHQNMRSALAAETVRDRFSKKAVLPDIKTIEKWGRDAARENPDLKKLQKPPRKREVVPKSGAKSKS